MKKTASQSLHELAKLGGLSAENVVIDGDDPVVRIRQRVIAAGAASIAATGMAAAQIWHTRSGRRQKVRVDTRAAALSLRAARLMAINGVSSRHGTGEPTNGFYKVRDGRWVYLHCNFENIRRNNAAVLGGVLDRGAMERAALSWDGEELEEAIFKQGGVCGFVRSEEEWNATPQAKGIANLPLLEIVKIGEAPPEPFSKDGTRPLSGIRALDLTRVLAGPMGARTLVEHGADVMKISRKGLQHGGLPDFDAEIGKLSAYVDMRHEMDTLHSLISRSDVFMQGYRPGTLANRGLSPADIAKLRPGIVYTTLSAWGHEGPWKDRRGFDTVVQSASGFAYRPDNEPPVLLPVSALDYVAGYLMAYGTMIALDRRAREGGSWFVRTSLAGVRDWIRNHGLNREEDIAGLTPELPPDQAKPFMMESPSLIGTLTHLRPAVQMSETKAELIRPSVPHGYNKPVWPDEPSGSGIKA